MTFETDLVQPRGIASVLAGGRDRRWIAGLQAFQHCVEPRASPRPPSCRCRCEVPFTDGENRIGWGDACLMPSSRTSYIPERWQVSSFLLASDQIGQAFWLLPPCLGPLALLAQPLATFLPVPGPGGQRGQRGSTGSSAGRAKEWPAPPATHAPLHPTPVNQGACDAAVVTPATHGLLN